MNHLFRTQLLVSNSLRRLPLLNNGRLVAMGLRRGEQTERPIEKKTRNESDIRMDDQPPLHPSSYGKQQQQQQSQQEHHTATEKLKNWFENVMGVSNEEAIVRNDLNTPLERDQNRNRTNMSSTTTRSQESKSEAERYNDDLNRLNADIENKAGAFPEGQTTIPASESESKIKQKPWESVNQPDKMKNKAWSTGGSDVSREDRVWSAGGVEAQKVINPESNFSKDSKDSLWKESAQQGRQDHKPWTTSESSYPKDQQQNQDASSSNKGSDFVVDQDGHAKENVHENEQRSHKVQ